MSKHLSSEIAAKNYLRENKKEYFTLISSK